MDLRGIILVKTDEEAQAQLVIEDEKQDGAYRLKVYQTGFPQSNEMELVGTLFIFANGETKLVEHRSED